MATAATDLPDRLAAARAALTRAETATGLRTRFPGAPTPSGAPALPGATAQGPSVASSPPPPTSGLPGEELPVPAALAPLFPGGALARGGVVQVGGSTSLLLTLAAAAGAAGAWAALAALPDVGWRAAAEAGLDLERVIVVPRPGPDAPAVVGALVDGVDLLVVGRCPALAERDRRSLAARLRARQAVLLSTDPWPGAGLVLHAEHVAWEGIGQGWGALSRQRMTVTALGRGGPARTVEVSLGPDGVRSVGAPARGQDHPILRAVG